MSWSSAGAEEGYYRHPTLAGDAVVFTAEGDLWSAPIAGGRASRLTTHPAEETNAVASPDGKSLAFAATYDGPLEVCVMPLAGGIPRRVSFDGARSLPVGWTPAGEVLYVTQKPTGPTPQLIVVAVDPSSLHRHALPLADVSDAGSPLFAFGTGGLLVENEGVEPDVVVENPPHATYLGEDAQLDVAIRTLVEKLKTEPVPRL